MIVPKNHMPCVQSPHEAAQLSHRRTRFGMQKRTLIILGVLALGSAGLYAGFREPPTPFEFLNKFPIVEQKSVSNRTLRAVVFKAD